MAGRGAIAVTMHTLGMLTMITFIALAAPFISDRLASRFIVPSLVVELVLGVIAGPTVLHLVDHDDVIDALSDLGLAALMFLAGYEVQVARTRGIDLRRAAIGWVASLVLGLTAGVMIGGVTGGVVIGLALATTALGTIVPILSDHGMLDTPFGTSVLAVGAVGEFCPIIAIAFALSSQRPTHTLAVLVVFVGLSLLGVWLARKPRHPRLGRLVRETLGTSAQVAVRLCMFVIVAMFALAEWLGLDPVLGAFTAGVMIRVFLQAGDAEEAEIVQSRVEAISYGLLIPIFFVVSGVHLDIRALLSDVGQLLMVPVFVALFLVVRGLPTYVIYRGVEPLRGRVALSLLAATALPLIVVITSLGVEEDVMSPSRAAALVTAGVVSVLVFPAVAIHLQPHSHLVTRSTFGGRKRATSSS